MATPFNYAGIMAQGQSLVPDLLEREIQRSIGQAQAQQAGASAAQAKMQTAALQQKMASDLVASQEQRQYADDVQVALESGDMREISRLMARYPQYKDALKASYDQMDTASQRSNMQQAAGMWSALNAGNTDAAIKMLDSRIAADRAAGEDTADDEERLAMLKSGDRAQVNTVKGQLGLFMASVIPEKFSSVIEQLGTGAEPSRKGQIVGRAIGHYDDGGNFVVDYRDPENFTLSEGQTRFEGAGGAPPPITGPMTVQNVMPHIMAQESGGDYGARNTETGAMGAYQVMPATGQALAKRLGLPWRPDMMTATGDAARAYQDRIGAAAVQEAIEASGGDPMVMAQYYHGGSDRSKWGPRTRQYGQEVVARLGGGQASSGGGARAVASVAKSPSASGGKAPPSGYMWADSSQTALTPIPGGPADKGEKTKDGAYSQSALDAFDRAIGTADRLMKHPGLDSAVGMKGLTGGFLGGWVVPGTDAADFNAELDAMKAQVFLPMVQSMKGMGALSNAEGEKLTAAIGALSTKQSEKQFKASLGRIVQDLRTYKARGMPQLQGAGAVQVRSIQEAQKLKPGTLYRTPTGQVMRR